MITIIITYYNFKYFRETLQSLVNQTNKDFKVFVGNDKSPDDPFEIINEFQDLLDLTYIKFDENVGGKDLTKQWIRCLDFITTEWFLILGDDDLLHKNAVDEFYKTKKGTSDFNVFRFSIQRIDNFGKPTTQVITYTDGEKSTDFFVKKASQKVLSSLGEYVFNTKKIKKVGIVSYPKAFYSDDMMVLQASDFGPIKNVTHGIAFIRVSENSFSGDLRNKTFLNKAAILFYTDLIKKYRDKFSINDVYEFYPYFIRSYFKNEKTISTYSMFNFFMNKQGILFLLTYVIKIIKRGCNALFK